MAIPSPSPSPVPGPPPVVVSTFWTCIALLFALIGVAGTLWMSLGNTLIFGMDLIPCSLCFFQRTIILSLAAVLLLGLLGGPRRSGYLSMITLPLTVVGLGVAGFHVYREYHGNPVLECPDGVIVSLHEEYRGQDDLYQQMHGLVTGPKESLAIFVLIFLVQMIDILRSGTRGGFGPGAFLGGIILGGCMAAALLATMGPGKIPEAGELKGCRPMGGK